MKCVWPLQQASGNAIDVLGFILMKHGLANYG